MKLEYFPQQGAKLWNLLPQDTAEADNRSMTTKRTAKAYGL